MMPKALRRKQAGILQALPGGAHAQNDAYFRSLAKRQSPPEPCKSFGRFGFTFPNHNHPPAEFAENGLMGSLLISDVVSALCAD
jgi:hypothetical protein